MDRKERLDEIYREIRKDGDKEEAIILLYTSQADTLNGIVGCRGQMATLANLLVALLRSNPTLKKVYDYYNAKAEITETIPEESLEKVSKDKN